MKRLCKLLCILLVMLILPVQPCAAETHPLSLANETMQNLLTEQSDLFVESYQEKLFGEQATEKPFAHRFRVSAPIIAYDFALRFSNAGGQIHYGQRYRYYFSAGMEAAYRLIDTPTVYYVLYYMEKPVGLVSLQRCVGGYEPESIDVPKKEKLLQAAAYLIDFLDREGVSYDHLGCGLATKYELVFTEGLYNGYVADDRIGGIHRTRDLALSTLQYLDEGDFGVAGIPRPGGGLEHITRHPDPFWSAVIGIPVILLLMLLTATLIHRKTVNRKKKKSPDTQ